MKRWTQAEFDAKFFSRSPEQVIREGHSCYRFPCPDISSVAAELLLANGFEPTVSLEKHINKGEEGIHLSVEFLLDGKPVHFKVTRSEIKIVPGFLKDNPRRRIIKKIQLSKSHFSVPYFSLFGVKNMPELKSIVGANYLGLLEGKMHRINSRASRAGAMLSRARFRTGRTIKNFFIRKK